MTTPISIYLVDDNPTFLRIAARFLQEQDGLVVVGTAEDSHQAMVHAPPLQPEVILLDLSLADSSGLEAIGPLRTALPAVRIIILTLHDRPEYRQAALAAGADDFIAKATMSDDLLPAIRRQVGRLPDALAA